MNTEYGAPSKQSRKMKTYSHLLLCAQRNTGSPNKEAIKIVTHRLGGEGDRAYERILSVYGSEIILIFEPCQCLTYVLKKNVKKKKYGASTNAKKIHQEKKSRFIPGEKAYLGETGVRAAVRRPRSGHLRPGSHSGCNLDLPVLSQIIQSSIMLLTSRSLVAASGTRGRLGLGKSLGSSKGVCTSFI